MKKAEKLSAAYFPKRPIHKEWVDLLKGFKKYLDWYRDDSDDVAYWYGERALSGYLALAAWDLSGGWSLEEFTGRRKHGRKKSAGRGDLWLGAGTKAFTVEAKVEWPGGPTGTAINSIHNKLGLAKSQLSKLGSDYREGVPTAVCYVVPDLNTKTKYGTPTHIDELYAEIERTFSTGRRVVGSFRYKGNLPSDSGRIYPGVIVIAEFLPSWNNG